MTRFDIHVNLGSFPGSRRGEKQRFISPQEMNEYFISHKITHSLVLYNRDEYNLLETLGKLTKTKIYGVQCVMGPKDSPTDITKPFNFDIGKEFVYGIKIASERGWWTDGKETWSGIDYTHKYINKIISQLPPNSVVSMHTQGTSKPDNTSRPMTISKYACKFPELKFIINHGGDYGPKTQTARPSEERILNRQGMSNLLRNVSHKMIIKSGLESSQGFPNVFVDSSCYTTPKGEYYRDYDQWCVGSDFPFSHKHGIDYTSERNEFEKSCYIPDDNAVDFFEKDIVSLTHSLFEYNREERRKFNLEKKNIHSDQQRVIYGKIDSLVDVIEEHIEHLKEEGLEERFKRQLIETIKNI